MHLPMVCVLAWLGIVGGDCCLYHFGKAYGLNITKVPFVGKHLTKERILKAERLFGATACGSSPSAGSSPASAARWWWRPARSASPSSSS